MEKAAMSTNVLRNKLNRPHRAFALHFEETSLPLDKGSVGLVGG